MGILRSFFTFVNGIRYSLSLKNWIMKEVKYVLAWLIGFNTLVLDAQTLSGNFTSMAGEWVRFGTFQGIQSPVLDSARIDVNGAFSFTFKTDKY